MDRVGIPNVHINAFLSIAQSVGSNRIVFGGDFTAPTGNPDLPPDREKVYRRKIIDKGIRPDGRELTQVRPIWCEVGLLPRAHGSAVFTRGQTQVMSVCTLGSMS